MNFMAIKKNRKIFQSLSQAHSINPCLLTGCPVDLRIIQAGETPCGTASHTQLQVGITLGIFKTVPWHSQLLFVLSVQLVCKFLGHLSWTATSSGLSLHPNHPLVLQNLTGGWRWMVLNLVASLELLSCCPAMRPWTNQWMHHGLIYWNSDSLYFVGLWKLIN